MEDCSLNENYPTLTNVDQPSVWVYIVVEKNRNSVELFGIVVVEFKPWSNSDKEDNRQKSYLPLLAETDCLLASLLMYPLWLRHWYHLSLLDPHNHKNLKFCHSENRHYNNKLHQCEKHISMSISINIWKWAKNEVLLIIFCCFPNNVTCQQFDQMGHKYHTLESTRKIYN